MLDMSAKDAYIVVVPKKRLTGEEVLSMLKKRQGDRSLREFAEELGVSPAYLSDIYSGNRNPGPAVLGHFGLSKVVESSIYYESVA